MNPEEMTAALNAMLEQGNQLRASKLVPVLTNITGKFNVLEDIMGITLDPDLDKKYYKYFTIEATQDGTTIYFRQSHYAVTDSLDPLKVEISTDNGKTWTEITAAPAENGAPGAVLAELNGREKVLIRGRNEAYGYYSPADTLGASCENCNFYTDKPCYVYGNIMSLINDNDFARLRKVKENAFAYFFSDYDEELDRSWVLSKEDEELLLPATTLASNCYCNMFRGCVGLTTAPELPATTLASNCYRNMFYDCTSLTAAPELPATTLADYCYNSMFNNCVSLTTTPELPATTLASNCYNSMFRGCHGLTAAPELPATTLASNCYSSMFHGCTGLTATPELPATTLASNCYSSMFSGCTGLTAAPELPAITLASNCYNSMFYGCTGLTAAPELPAITVCFTVVRV